jgi:hypothetical protein
VMLLFRWWQFALEIPGRISFRSTCSYCIAEYLSAVLHRPMGCFQRAAAFDPAEYR